jgi:hypothetical protein
LPFLNSTRSPASWTVDEFSQPLKSQQPEPARQRNIQNYAMAPAISNEREMITVIARAALTSTPQAPPATGRPSNDGFSPAAIIGVVAAIVILLILVPLVAVILRRYERKRCMEMLPDSASTRAGSSKSSVREDQSLRSIMVTKEVQRSSIKVDSRIKRPEEAYAHERGWSRTEVRGGT